MIFFLKKKILDPDAMVEDDMFIVHTFNKWCFGNDDTGNCVYCSYF